MQGLGIEVYRKFHPPTEDSRDLRDSGAFHMVEAINGKSRRVNINRHYRIRWTRMDMSGQGEGVLGGSVETMGVAGVIGKRDLRNG